jgi:hypothetical protein
MDEPILVGVFRGSEANQNCNTLYLCLGLDVQATGEALKLVKENIQHFKTINFFTFVSFLWVI